MKKITKAIIPAAGLGTRVLPATKSMAKEMLTIVDKPAIQYIVEEAVKAGITDILIITSRGKTTIEDHFDRSPELEDRLLSSGKTELYNEILEISNLANISYIRQKETKGLGHAVLCAKNFVGQDDFLVLYGDDVIIGDDPVCSQLIRAHEKYGKSVVGVNAVTEEQIQKYCSLKVEKLEDRCFLCDDMIEKPKKEEIFSLYSILGRCLLSHEIFEILEETKPGAGGEIQLTDAMATLARNEGVIAVDFTGNRYDMGNKLGIMKAAIEVGVNHKEIGEDLKSFLKDFVKTI